jgi:hypothetical protein
MCLNNGRISVLLLEVVRPKRYVFPLLRPFEIKVNRYLVPVQSGGFQVDQIVL